MPRKVDFKALEWVDFEAMEGVWFSGPSVGLGINMQKERSILRHQRRADLKAPGSPF